MSRWDGPYSSAAYSLAKELSKNHRVFYIDHPFTLKDFVSRYSTESISRRKSALLWGENKYQKIKNLPDNFIAVTPKLTFPINVLPEGRIYDYCLSLNNKIVSSTIKAILTDFNINDYIFFNSYNPFFDDILPEDHLPKLRIYQSRDDISESDYVSKHGVNVERRALERADFCFATSKELCRNLSTDEIKVIHLPNAADISAFNRALEPLPRPKELQGLENKKIIGYTGNIGLRIDYPLLKKVAENYPDHILLMVGPRDDKRHTDIDLDQYPNIIFTGGKDLYELPPYLHYMDCAIIPFECNKLTASIYPLKINEYLAAGKPVVSTNFSEDIADFKGVVELAANHQDFIDKIGEAIKNNNEEQIKKRVMSAEKNTWEARVELFWQVINTGSKKMKISSKNVA